MASYDFDLITIGAGSGGVRASRMAAAAGVRVAVAEAGALGGTCVNRGCIPKKLMVYASEFASTFADASGYGWTVGTPTFDWARLMAAKDREIERLNGIYRDLLERPGATILRGRARLADRHVVEVDGVPHSADRILIATGGRPEVPDVPGIEHAVTSDEVFHLQSLPERVVIVGGGYIGVEFSGVFHGLGADVTLLHHGSLLLHGFDHDLAATLGDEMRKRGVDLHLNTTLGRIDRDHDRLLVTARDGSTFEGDLVLCATGRVPNTAGLGLEAVGVELDERGAVVVDAASESSVPGIYAVGDCTDREALTPVAIAEAMALVDTLYNGRPSTVDYAHVPTAVFGQPPAAAVGLTEEEARARGHELTVYRTSVRPLLHALSGRDEHAMLKLVVDRSDGRVLGLHMVGPDAPEIVQAMAVAIRAGLTKDQLDATMALHPTLAEELVTMRAPVPAAAPEARGSD